MSNHMKKHGFLLDVPRLFTREGTDAYHDIHFRPQQDICDEALPALESPDGWSAEASELLAEQAASTIPASLKAIEENTTPSWLWRHVGEGKGTSRENSVQQIFNRIAGAATYNAWKQSLFSSESGAQNFYDEVRYALSTRLIAIEPLVLANLGLNWAYGIKRPLVEAKTKTEAIVDIPNTTIDAVIGGNLNKDARGKWQKTLSAKSGTPVTLRFSDVASEWGVASVGTPVMLDLMAFRHNDGAVNIAALRHAVRLTVMLMDLQDDAAQPLRLGFSNLAPLLAALTIAYDSEAGRTMAAALSAVITAEAYITSADLARLRGLGASYTQNREAILRSLRNHRRAAYGDHNDYEKISVLPVPLGLEKCPDLALAAAAQRAWDDALDLVRQHGLRATQVTAIVASPALALFARSATQGIEPLSTLVTLQQSDEDAFSR
ncbi:MAG TPA: hypothetical protein VFR09_08465, partial [Alphaproteobacteria bacterium]|nr:hypothetical protein [Alphaproteobacteria bacterium]